MEAAGTGNLDCVKLLLRFGAKINIDGARFTECGQDRKEIAMILFAAGENSAKLAESLKPQKGTNLKHICSDGIRKHPFDRVPRLGLPAALTDYLLFNMSIEKKNNAVLSESESESEYESESESE